jgi:hypothetical protein
MKICTKCKQSLDESQFTKDNKRKDKLNLWCKKCSHKNNKDTCNKTKEKNINNINIIEEKKCIKCGRLKKIEFFSINKNRKDGHNNWCKDCINNYSKNIYRKNNKEKLKEKAKSDHIKRYYNNREKELNRTKIYKQNNKEKINNE